MNDSRPATQSLACPTEGCTGTLAAYTSKKLRNGDIKRRRKCDCCNHREVVILRPAVVMAIRIVKKSGSEKNTSSTKQI
jgi:transcriptional regulator NrdR family protein